MSKTIFVINGSASKNSSNLKLIEYLKLLEWNDFVFQIFDDLKKLPHFDPEQSNSNPPQSVKDFIQGVNNADGVIICTPEYIFSVPSGLKNALEWCVSTVVFEGKPTGLITASAHGQKGHDELQLIMRTLSANFISGSTLLVQGVKGKITLEGKITDDHLKDDLDKFIASFKNLFSHNGSQ